jgi:hypothetical protein
MKRVDVSEVLPRKQYESVRDSFRKTVMQQKEERRIHLGEHLTFLFENHDTILYQVQEMMRTESIDGADQIKHEVETYNELIGERGEIGATLLIEIDDPEKRNVLLRKWLDLPKHLYLKTQQGQKVFAQFDERQVGEQRISSVHYLKFKVGDQVPVAIGSSHPELSVESALSQGQTMALCKDLMKS